MSRTIMEEELIGLPQASRRNIEVEAQRNIALDRHGAQDFRTITTVLEDDVSRPLWIGSNGKVYLETFSPMHREASEFMLKIAQPVCHPKYIEEYTVTAYSLYTAASGGLQTHDIIHTLKRFCKTSVPKSICEFIEACTLTYGKVRLIVKGNRYFVESGCPKVIHILIKNADIQDCMLWPEKGIVATERQKAAAIMFTSNQGQIAGENTQVSEGDMPDGEDEEEDKDLKTLSFEIKVEKIQTLEKTCNALRRVTLCHRAPDSPHG